MATSAAEKETELEQLKLELKKELDIRYELYMHSFKLSSLRDTLKSEVATISKAVNDLSSDKPVDKGIPSLSLSH